MPESDHDESVKAAPREPSENSWGQTSARPVAEREVKGESDDSRVKSKDAARDEAPASGAPRMPLLSELIAEESRKNLASNPPKAIAERWEVQNRLGQGGMSTVYRARHLVMNKICAVKILNSNLTSKAESLQRFQREAKAASSLNHPNIVSVLDCGITAEQHAFLIMDYLEGESLGDLLHKEHKLPPERAVPIFLQTCEALMHAHERSVIHRDLKPSNLMLVENDGKKDFVKIVDFGIAKLLDVQLSQNDETHQRLTHTGDIFGSPLYMSPEQCSGRESDRRSDIYSMGCLMYETLSGVPPFVGANTLDTIRLKMSDTAAPISTPKSDRLLKRLNAIVHKCLEQEPDDRYSSMELLRQDIILARDESEAGWHSKALANRRRLRWSWLQVTPKKIILTVLAAVVLSVGTTVYIDYAASNIPSEYDSKSLWSGPKMDISKSLFMPIGHHRRKKPEQDTTAGAPALAQKTLDKSELQVTEAPILAPGLTPLVKPLVAPSLAMGVSNQPIAEIVTKELINMFIDADRMRVDKKYAEAEDGFNEGLRQWNGHEAQDLPGAKWSLTTTKAFCGLGLCKAKLGKHQQANDCYLQAIDYAQKDPETPPELIKDMQKMCERNLWKVNPVKAMMRVLSKQEMLPPGAS